MMNLLIFLRTSWSSRLFRQLAVHMESPQILIKEFCASELMYGIHSGPSLGLKASVDLIGRNGFPGFFIIGGEDQCVLLEREGSWIIRHSATLSLLHTD